MHHKRRRPKNRRAGCLMCKPWKVNGVARGGSNYEEYRLKPSERRRVQRGPDDEGDRAAVPE
ncbi:MAG: hypothetical protein ACYTAO_02135 [Planctomycetota bacterium]